MAKALSEGSNWWDASNSMAITFCYNDATWTRGLRRQNQVVKEHYRNSSRKKTSFDKVSNQKRCSVSHSNDKENESFKFVSETSLLRMWQFFSWNLHTMTQDEPNGRGAHVRHGSIVFLPLDRCKGARGSQPRHPLFWPRSSRRCLVSSRGCWSLPTNIADVFIFKRTSCLVGQPPKNASKPRIKYQKKLWNHYLHPSLQKAFVNPFDWSHVVSYQI